MTEENSTEKLWVIKDNYDKFAHSNSIREIEKGIVSYIRYHRFGEECRGFTTRGRALIMLELLNDSNAQAEFDVIFHLEYLNSRELSKQYLEFKGENMIITEKPLVKTIKPIRNVGK